MKKVGIIGGAGYTGGELIRLIESHPNLTLDYATSRSQAGELFSNTHHDMFHDDRAFTDQVHFDVDVIFICAGHGQAKVFMDQHDVPADMRIIDLSHDFRMKGAHGFVYGLPELNQSDIRMATRIANPGCFATSIQLALLPAAKNKLLDRDVHIHAITGSTGAGQAPTATGHFSWRNNNISIYKAFNHQHLLEINQSLQQENHQFDSTLHFVPMRGNFTRGIFASIYWKTSASETTVLDAYREYFKPHPFVYITDRNPNLKSVVNTNYCLLHIKKHGDHLHIISMIDNLIKGASGQALQNYNIMTGIPQEAGLKLKPSYF